MYAKAHSAAVVLAALAALAPTGAGAWSLFGSQRAKLFEAAEAQFQAATEARAEGRVFDEYDALVFALRDYSRLATEFPDWRADAVRERGADAQARLAELTEGIRGGTIAVPDPDDPSARAAAANVFAAGEIPPPSEGDGKDAASRSGGDRYPTPALVAMASATAPVAAPELASVEAPAQAEVEPDPETLARISAPIPNPFFSPDEDEPAPATKAVPEPSAPVRAVEPPAPAVVAALPEKVPAAEPATAAEGDKTAKAAPVGAKTPQPVPEAKPSETREDASVRLRAYAAMIKSGQASEAVILLEDALEDSPDGPAAVQQRVLLARALLECRNAPRAADELAALPADAASDPSVRSLKSAVAIAAGKFPEAILELHLLVDENPDWSDAWVDLAWANFLLDPAANRDSSVSYYRNALSRGARRDPELERKLRVRVGK